MTQKLTQNRVNGLKEDLAGVEKYIEAQDAEYHELAASIGPLQQESERLATEIKSAELRLKGLQKHTEESQHEARMLRAQIKALEEMK